MMIQDILDFITYNFINGENIKISLLDVLLLIASLVGTSIILRFIRTLISKRLPADDKKRFGSVFQVVNYIIYLFVIVFMLNATGVNMNVFLTASAALFVGLGFALQTFFQDIISGVLIILDQSLHVGDIIEIEDRVGRVQEIKLRTTIMVTRNDRVMIIPNHKFMTDTLFNWTQNSSINREQVHVGVAYGSDVRLVEKLLIEAASTTKGISEDHLINVTFNDFADSSLSFSLNFYVLDGMKSPSIKSEIRFKIDDLFKQHNIEIPFPQRVVTHVNK